MIRKARIKDAPKIRELINGFAKNDLMMPRSLNEIFENIRDYWVVDNPKKKIIGCVGLHIVGWDDLAEIKSLAVDSEHQKTGVGTLLVATCLKEAAELNVANVFALSYKPKFFKKFGFKVIAKSKLPHKVWAECCNCPKFPNCGEVALIKKIR